MAALGTHGDRCESTTVCQAVHDFNAGLTAMDRIDARCREGEALLSEILKLSRHLGKLGYPFLTLGHENRIAKYLCILPREDGGQLLTPESKEPAQAEPGNSGLTT